MPRDAEFNLAEVESVWISVWNNFLWQKVSKCAILSIFKEKKIQVLFFLPLPTVPWACSFNIIYRGKPKSRTICHLLLQGSLTARWGTLRVLRCHRRGCAGRALGGVTSVLCLEGFLQLLPCPSRCLVFSVAAWNPSSGRKWDWILALEKAAEMLLGASRCPGTIQRKAQRTGAVGKACSLLGEVLKKWLSRKREGGRVSVPIALLLRVIFSWMTSKNSEIQNNVLFLESWLMWQRGPVLPSAPAR